MRTKKCHKKNLWDNSLLKTGDRVMSKLTGEVGTVFVKTCIPPNMEGFTYLEVVWDNEDISTPYSNQLVLISG